MTCKAKGDYSFRFVLYNIKNCCVFYSKMFLIGKYSLYLPYQFIYLLI